MNFDELRGTLARLRDVLGCAEVLAANARPDALARCTSMLDGAAAELHVCRSHLAAHRGNPTLLSQAREIRRRLERLRRLLDQAAGFHNGRRRVLGGMLAGYTAGGAAAEWRPPARLSVRG